MSKPTNDVDYNHIQGILSISLVLKMGRGLPPQLRQICEIHYIPLNDLDTLCDIILEYFCMSAVWSEPHPSVVALAEALSTHDPDRACAAIQAHIAMTRSIVLESLKQLPHVADAPEEDTWLEDFGVNESV